MKAESRIGIRAWLRAHLLRALVLACMAAPAHSQSTDDALKAEFDAAYAAYNEAIGRGDSPAALDAARRALDAGTERFGSSSRNTAALMMNYGQMLAASGDAEQSATIYQEAADIYADIAGPNSVERADAILALADVQPVYKDRLATVELALSILSSNPDIDEVTFADFQSQGAEILASAQLDSNEAMQLYSEALSVLEENFGDSSMELVPALIALGMLELQGKQVNNRRVERFERAVEIVSTSIPDNAEAIADLELRIGQILSSSLNGSDFAIEYVARAADRLDQAFGAEHPKSASASFVYGQALLRDGVNEAGVERIEAAIEFYEGKPEYARNERSARYWLIGHFRRAGDDARYGEQLAAFALLENPSGQADDQLPIVKVAPVYPPQAAQRGLSGYVEVQFTVDERGRTKDLEVIDSSNRLFEAAAIRAAEQFIYIPRFENGKPVSVPEVRNTITFVLEN